MSSLSAIPQKGDSYARVPLYATREDLVARSQIIHHRRRRRILHDDAVTSDQQAALALENCNVYAGVVRIGDPPQSFSLTLDTATSDIWVLSSSCRDKDNVQDETCPDDGKQRFDATASTSYRDAAKGNPCEINYNITLSAKEYLRGINGRDTVIVGDSDKAAVTAKHQVFAAVYNYETTLSDCQDGLLGLGSATHIASGAQSVLGHLISQWRHQMFSLYTTGLNDDRTASSELVFGGVDQRHYQGCLVWHEISQSRVPGGGGFQSYWEIPLEGSRVGDSTLPSTPLAIVDSKSFFMIAPSEVVAAIAKNNNLACFQVDDMGIPDTVECDVDRGVDMVAMDCEGTLQPIDFYIGHETYTLEHDDMVMVQATSIGEICLVRLLASPDLQSWILGSPFLNKYYTVFDLEKKRIGLARSSEDHKEICSEDWLLDVRYNDATLAPTPPPDTERPPNTERPPDIPPPHAGPTSAPPAPPTPTETPASQQSGSNSASLVFLALVFGSVVVFCVCRLRRQRERQRRLDRYSLASRYDDGEIFAEHELELT